MVAKRLRITIEFNKNSLTDLKLYQELIKFGNPGNLIKDILKGLLPVDILSKNAKEED